MRKALMITSVVVAVAATAGCGGGDATADPTPAPVATVGQTEPAEPPEVDASVRTYIDALAATDDPSTMGKG
jgi:hypothetical protein